MKKSVNLFTAFVFLVGYEMFAQTALGGIAYWADKVHSEWLCSTMVPTTDTVMHWASEVLEWDGNVMNYGLQSNAELMTEDSTWWLTGAPDSDIDGNGYAFDNVDMDHVAGWRNCGSDPDKIEWFTVKFDTPLRNGEGNDLVMVTYGGSKTQASVWGGADGENFFFLGYLHDGTPGVLEEKWFDFSDAITGNPVLLDGVLYVKVLRMTTGPSTGRFFDAIGGKYVVPEPGMWILVLALSSCGLFWSGFTRSRTNYTCNRP